MRWQSERAFQGTEEHPGGLLRLSVRGVPHWWQVRIEVVRRNGDPLTGCSLICGRQTLAAAKRFALVMGRGLNLKEIKRLNCLVGAGGKKLAAK